MHIDDFAPNLSFFFSNGMDPEYTVMGRVARRIWAVAMKEKYGANERSQKLKYHIQTSGRSLHAQEIQFNDIRTTLQALIAIYDNCNSLHTNAFDEAITTPTEDSVRRAMAIQLIINREWGLAKNENPNQGAFIIDELTELVEEAVLSEFEKIAERGGVLGCGGACVGESCHEQQRHREEGAEPDEQRHVESGHRQVARGERVDQRVHHQLGPAVGHEQQEDIKQQQIKQRIAQHPGGYKLPGLAKKRLPAGVALKHIAPVGKIGKQHAHKPRRSLGKIGDQPVGRAVPPVRGQAQHPGQHQVADPVDQGGQDAVQQVQGQLIQPRPLRAQPPELFFHSPAPFTACFLEVSPSSPRA